MWSLAEEADRTLLLPFLIKSELTVTRKEGLRPLKKSKQEWTEVDAHVHLKQTDGEGSYGSAE